MVYDTDQMDIRNEQSSGRTENQTKTNPTTNRVTVADAALLLGTSAEAVRMRVKRGTLASEKVGGTVYVLLNADQTRPNTKQRYNRTKNKTTNTTQDQTSLVDVLQEQVTYLREQLDQEREANRENRRIIAGLVQRVPELEPARESSEDRGPDVSAPAEGQGANVSPEGSQAGQEAEKQQSWLKRFFFGP